VTSPRDMNERELLEQKPWYNPGKWYTTPATWLPEVRATMPDLPKEIHIQDVTLREATTNISVFLNVEQKVEIARRLNDIGVLSLDCGYAGNADDEEAVKRIIAAGVVKKPTRILMDLVCYDISKEADALKKASDRVAEINATAFCPVVKHRPRNAAELDSYLEVFRYIKENHPDLEIYMGFIMTSGGMYYFNNLPSTRSNFDWQVELAKLVTEAGVDRINLADSEGIASPPAWKYIAGQFRKAIGPNKGLQVHNHNDYGQALANALAAVEGGANWLDVSVCGLGHRAGNTALEEAVMAIEALYGVKTGVRLESLYAVCKYVQEVSGAKVQPWKAIVGDKIWYESASASGNLMQLKREGKDFFEAGEEVWNPKVVGQTHRILFGKESMAFYGSGAANPAVVEGFLKHLGLKSDKGTIANIMQAILKEIEKRGAQGQDRFLTEEEVNEMCKTMAK